MVLLAGQTPTMDNREELLDALNDFSRTQSKEIPPLLEQFLKQVAKTGETLFPWTLLKALFVAKLEQVMGEFSEESPTDQLPSCPNVENARFDVYRARIMEAVHKFHGAPFTVQRLCELLTDPKRHYKRCDKFMRGLEKNILVVSTVDPFGRKVVSESKNLVNGMDGNNSSDDTPPSTSYSPGAPPVPSWSSSSPTAVWPLSADIITPSTSPLLEVCDLPDPKDASASSAAASTSDTASTDTSPSAASLNGHDGTSAASSSMEVMADSGGAVTSSQPADSSDLTSLSVVTPVTAMEETVDNSHQQVAAEEMVGVEEEAATSTAISPEAAATRVVEEAAVETQSVAAAGKETAQAEESSGDATSGSDWIGPTQQGLPRRQVQLDQSDPIHGNITDKEAKAARSSTEASSTEPQDRSGSDEGVNSTDTAPTESAPVPTPSPSVNVSEQDSSSTEADTSSNSVEEGGKQCLDDLASSKEGDTSECEPANKEDNQSGRNTEAEKVDPEEGIDPVKIDPVSSGSDSAAPRSDSPPISSSEESKDEAQSVDSSVPCSDSSEMETSPASVVLSTTDPPSTCSESAVDLVTSSSITSSSPAATTTTICTSSNSGPVTSTEEEKGSATEPSSSAMETTDSNCSVPQAAGDGQSNAVASDSEKTEVQGEAGSADCSSQAEQMEQD